METGKNGATSAEQPLRLSTATFSVYNLRMSGVSRFQNILGQRPGYHAAVQR